MYRAGPVWGKRRLINRSLSSFLDYQCPACRTVAPSVSAAWDDGTATIVVRHLPLERIHPFAMDAAKAVVCAEWQGRMREAHEALLSDVGWVARRDWLGMAESVDVGDLLKFEECLGGREAEARVESDRRMAAELDIASTPTFVTERGVYPGVRGFTAALRESR